MLERHVPLEALLATFVVVALLANLYWRDTISPDLHGFLFLGFVIVMLLAFRGYGISLPRELTSHHYKWPIALVASCLVVFGAAAVTYSYELLIGFISGIHHAGELVGRSSHRFVNAVLG